MTTFQANERGRKCTSFEDNESIISVTKLYHTKTVPRGIFSDESLGTRSLPSRSQSSLSECKTNCVGVRTGLPVAAVSDVSFFDSSDQKFQHTLAIIKPEAARLMYKIETILAKNKFIVITKNVLRLAKDQAAEFYREHSLEPYFSKLVNHMASGPIVVYVLSKKDGVNEWRRLIGPADVSVAKTDFPLSLRAIFGIKSATGVITNAFHGSDSPKAARREIQFFFPNSQTARATGNDDDVGRYIDEFLMPEISVGLTEMIKNNPSDPLRWFANWLLNKKELHNTG